MINNVSLDAYSIFKDVYENRNIAQTANKLNVSPSSISYRIKILEESLNVKLFERKSFGVEPTASADELYYNINSALDVIKCAERNFIEKKTSNISNIYIGIHYNIDKSYIISVINEYIKIFPNMRIHFVEKGTQELVKLLENNKIDMIIDYLPISSDKKELKVEILKELHTNFVKISGAPDKFILPTIGSTIRTEIDSYLQNNNIKISMDYEVCSNELMINMIKEKMGIGYVIIEDFKKNIDVQIEYVPVLDDYPILHVCVAYKDENIPISVKKFIELLKENNI